MSRGGPSLGQVVAEATEELHDALELVDGVRHQPGDPGAGLDPPATVLGPPTLTWEGPHSDPSAATFVVYLVVGPDPADATARLLELLPAVTEALDEVRDAVVTRAEAGRYAGSNGDMPAYQITVEYAL